MGDKTISDRLIRLARSVVEDWDVGSLSKADYRYVQDIASDLDDANGFFGTWKVDEAFNKIDFAVTKLKKVAGDYPEAQTLYEKLAIFSKQTRKRLWMQIERAAKETVDLASEVEDLM